ncbi:MAG TPA: hypothetical protein VL486_06535 [Verrucomicrobiae bacterium]|nr:hypothetical protein [Verrucomicrobiae bacterium]
MDKVREHSRDEPYHLYVWNNNVDDPWVAQFLAPAADATLVNRERMALVRGHPVQGSLQHAMCLQRLYEAARLNGANYIVTLDTDAHPIRDGWLRELTSALNRKTVLAGVWRDELAPAIEPYVHPSCLCTTAEFIEANKLRLDYLPGDSTTRYDTLSCLTEKARQLGLNCHALRRSNRNQMHRLMGGIYGDLIYHHAAGSRRTIMFWGDRRSQELERWNQYLRDQLNVLLFAHHDRYINWLRGTQDFVFVLGMHRSGTSCLAGALEACGLFLGDVSRANPYNERGNHELPSVVTLHEEILRSNGGSWSAPPPRISVNSAQQQAIRDVAAKLSAHAPCGLKEPRMLLFVEHWLDVAGPGKMVASFRHPGAVAQSLARRDQMPEAQAHELWLRYNRRLIELHRQHGFPLLEFDLSNVDAYCATVAGAAVRLGLDPRVHRVREFVSRELDHSDAAQQPVPAVCRETYEYLMAHRYQPDPFEKLVVEMAGQRDLQPLPPPAEPGQDGGKRKRPYLNRLRQLLGKR